MWMHQVFRRVCKEILRFLPDDRAMILEMVCKYVHNYFSNFKEDFKKKMFADDDYKAISQALEKVSMVQDMGSVIQASKIALFLEEENLIKKVSMEFVQIISSTSLLC